jgi:hypothetical protein
MAGSRFGESAMPPHPISVDRVQDREFRGGSNSDQVAAKLLGIIAARACNY